MKTEKAFDVPDVECPRCGRLTIMGYMLYNQFGGHMHTLYVCTLWESKAPAPCGWSDWSVTRASTMYYPLRYQICMERYLTRVA